MATTMQLYDTALATLLRPGGDWATADVRLALLSSDHVFDAADTVWADVSAAEITGTGYPAGGAALAGKAVVFVSGTARLVADDLTFAALTATFRHAVIYVVGTVGGLVNPLLASIALDTADVVVDARDYPVDWTAGHVIAVGKG